jgi:hypothetical protein
MATIPTLLKDILPASIASGCSAAVLNLPISEAMKIVNETSYSGGLSQADIDKVNQIYDTYISASKPVSDSDSAYWKSSESENDAYWKSE